MRRNGSSATGSAGAGAAPARSAEPVRETGSFSAILRTTRPLSSIVAGTLTAASVTAGEGRLTLHGIAAGLAMMALAMCGFAVNDIFDYHKDRGAGIQRPVAAGALSRKSAAWLAIAMLLVTALFGAVAGSGWATLAFTTVMLVLYSPVAQRWPLCKDLYVAGLCCAPLYYGAVVGGRRFPWFSYAVLGCFVLGREVLMDADELPGDSRAGMRTLAAILGGRRTARIGATLMLLAAMSLVMSVHGWMATVMSAATLASLACVFAWPGLAWSRRILLTRLPMLVGSVALALASSGA